MTTGERCDLVSLTVEAWEASCCEPEEPSETEKLAETVRSGGPNPHSSADALSLCVRHTNLSTQAHAASRDAVCVARQYDVARDAELPNLLLRKDRQKPDSCVPPTTSRCGGVVLVFFPNH
jgi:hypothetical protein